MHIYISLTYVGDVAKIRDHILIYLPTLDTTLPPCIEPQARMNVRVSTRALEQWAANLLHITSVTKRFNTGDICRREQKKTFTFLLRGERVLQLRDTLPAS